MDSNGLSPNILQIMSLKPLAIFFWNAYLLRGRQHNAVNLRLHLIEQRVLLAHRLRHVKNLIKLSTFWSTSLSKMQLPWHDMATTAQMQPSSKRPTIQMSITIKCTERNKIRAALLSHYLWHASRHWGKQARKLQKHIYISSTTRERYKFTSKTKNLYANLLGML